MHESFLAYARFRYLKLAAALVVLSMLAYAVHEPPVPAYGGTWLGYTLGTLGALIIVLLLWFGVRKRQYRSTAGTLAGWLSAHVYLGGALLVIATLHTGFHFGWNVHTLAFVLMALVIVSGIYGVYAYVRYPEHLTSNRDGMLAETMLSDVSDLDREILALADKLGPRMHEITLRSVESTTIGGSAWRQLTRSTPQRQALTRVEETLNALEQQGKEEAAVLDEEKQQSTMMFMADRLSSARGQVQVEDVRQLLDLISRKKALVQQLERDVQFHALLSIWLYVHVPLSIGLLAALLVHVVSVFFYW